MSEPLITPPESAAPLQEQQQSRNLQPQDVGKLGHVALFKLSVPAIDLVLYTDHAVKAPSMLQQMKTVILTSRSR